MEFNVGSLQGGAKMVWGGGVGGGGEDDGESLTLASPDLSIFDYGQLHTDLMLITFQFS